MIRRLQKTDIDAVAQIWLTSNREAHDFVPAEYWESNFTPVKEMLLQPKYMFVKMRRVMKSADLLVWKMSI